MSQPWVHGMGESSWTVAGSHGEKSSAKAELVNLLSLGLESLCRAASGQLHGARRGRDQVWVGTSTVLFRTIKVQLKCSILKPKSRVFLVEFKEDKKRTRGISSRARGTQSFSEDEAGKAGFGCAWGGSPRTWGFS